MAFRAVQVHDLEGTFIGFAIQQDGSQKLHTANVWPEADADDLRQQLVRLNDQRAILAYWPDVRDPEVKQLTDDPEWEKLPLTATEVVDDKASVFVWFEEPSDENPYGKMDEENSIIALKTVMVPAPTDVQRRIKKACEIVARKRSEAANDQG